MADILRQVDIDADFDSLLQPFPGWDMEWIHLGPGSSSLRGTRVTFADGGFTSITASSAGILRGTTASNCLALITSPSSGNAPRSHAQPIGAGVGLVLGPAAALDLYLPAGGSVLVVATAADGSSGDYATRRAVDAPQGILLARCMDALEQLRISPAARHAQRRLREDLRTINAALTRDAGSLRLPERNRLQRHLAVIRACNYVDANLRAHIALKDLCEAAGVSTRALEYGFRDFYDLGPMAYVRNLRLCRVRHDLLDPTRNEHSVSGAARRWSFTHMGQFSHDYRALFGEMPSMTLAAHQRAAKASGSVS